MSRAVLSLVILAFLGSATAYETGLPNGKTLQATRSTFKAGEHTVHQYKEDELKKKSDHSMFFDGFVVKGLVDPALAEKERKDSVAISHRKVSKLTHEQKTHVEKKRLEEASEKSSEKRNSHSTLKSVESPETKSRTHLQDHDASAITYMMYSDYAEYETCGDVPPSPTFGIEIGKCFKCQDSFTGETRGCKAIYDYSLNAINYTSYESLTCDDYYWWMDRVTNTFPAGQCIWNSMRHTFLGMSNSYAYTNGGFSQGFYNTSSCWDAPMYYMKHRSMNTGTDTACYAYDGSEAFGVDQGCDYYYQYKDSYCSEPVYAAPMKRLIGMCMANEDEERLPFNHPYEIKMDHSVKRALFCGNGPSKPNPICMNKDGSACQDIFQSNLEGFVGIPSHTARVCKPHDNDDALKVKFVHMARDPMTNHGVIKVTIETPDYVSPTDRFRIVVKAFGDNGQKQVLSSFKYNGSPENNTLTFQTEGPFEPPFEPREATVKVKQRVYDKERAFVRKSCVRYGFPEDDDDDNYNDYQYPQPSYDSTQYPSVDQFV